MSPIDRKRLGEMLIDDGLITKEQLDEALNLQKQSTEKVPVGELLVQLGYLSEEGLALTLSKKLGTKYVSFSDRSLAINLDQNLDKLIDERTARDNLVLPMSKTTRHLAVAMWDPLNFVVIDNLKRMTSLDLIVYCSTKKDILEGIEKLYLWKGGSVLEGTGATTAEKMGVARDEADKLKQKAAEAPIIKIVNGIIQDAVRQKASDIHIEPQENGLTIRFRIDGILYAQEAPQQDITLAMLSRIKILSRLDISEKRLPQDGGFMMKVESRNIDLRVSTIPTIQGEKVAIRILDKEAISFNLSTIGFSPTDLERVNANIKKPYGLIFITGPTGSGKSTTLYCLLNEINSPQKNIVTIEDPVEYRINGANQVQTSPNIGLTFAAGLRSFLRQDPDIIMVGEVRDLETAEICVRSALVGRLVLSTLHTNDAVGAISRLVDFGIEPFLVASTINMIIGQRLVRKLCPDCKEPVKLDSKTIEKYKLKDVEVFAPKGCSKCSDRGFVGRLAIMEVLIADDEVRKMIEKREDVSVVRAALMKKGMKTFRDDGLDKVKQGLTSLNEALAATMEAI